MSSWVGNPGRPPYVIPPGSAGLKKSTPPPNSILDRLTSFDVRRYLGSVRLNEVSFRHPVVVSGHSLKEQQQLKYEYDVPVHR